MGYKLVLEKTKVEKARAKFSRVFTVFGVYSCVYAKPPGVSALQTVSCIKHMSQKPVVAPAKPIAQENEEKQGS